MSHTHTRRRCQHLSALFCLLLLLSACSQLSGNGPSSTPTPAQTTTSPTASTPGQAQTCPAQATARSALMSPLPTSNHPTLVYVSQQGDISILQRYDATTGSRQTLLQTRPGETIQRANVSPDGQWILFRSLLQGQVALQLIRVDGQQLQTLYCAPAQEDINDALLSPDQHTLVFNQENQDGLSTLYLLDVATGKLRTELSPLQPHYPEIAQGQLQTTLMSEFAPTTLHDKTTGKITTHPFNPLPSKHYLIYVPMKWANNTSVYVIVTVGRSGASAFLAPEATGPRVYVFGTAGGSGGAPIHELALLRDTRKDVTQQGSNLQAIATAGQDFACLDEDITPDNAQLVCSAFPFTGPANPADLANAIKMWPITAGVHRTVYQVPPGESIIARAISNSTLLFLLTQANGPSTLWKINTDGSGLARLMAARTTDVDLEFASSGYFLRWPSYLPWSITSRDGRHYALTMSNITRNASALIVGDLNSGQPKTIASSAASLLLAGWA